MTPLASVAMLEKLALLKIATLEPQSDFDLDFQREPLVGKIFDFHGHSTQFELAVYAAAD